MRRGAHLSISAFLCAVILTGAPDTRELFESRVRPVLVAKCYGCHGAGQQLSGLRVDSREALLQGGKRGPSIVPGAPDRSALVRAIRHEDLRMPIGGKLSPAEITAIEEWIRNGAPWPKELQSKTGPAADRYAELVRTHWAFQPVNKSGAVPAGREYSNPIDGFITAQLAKSGLTISKPADRRILIRRLSYVLTGLPPSAAEVDEFANDTSSGAYENLVDRLLASPHFGEQWGRHWLDVVRYAETRGYEWNYEIVGAWRYRDYIIRALNDDVPYDQLVREHIAGDLLAKPRINVTEGANESVIGTAFFRLGEAGHDDCIQFREIALDVADNQIDTMTKAFQGLTVSCARCHDHKLDPIPTQDYYGLYSILNSSRAVTHSIDLPQVYAEPTKRIVELKSRIRAELAAIWAKEVKQLAGALTPALTGTNESSSPEARRWIAAIATSATELENPGYPLAKALCETGSQERWLSQSFQRVFAEYDKEQNARHKFNSENYSSFGDFRSKDYGGWSGTGAGLSVSDSGDFAVTGEGELALSGVYERGSYTNAVSERLNGALRSPYLPKDKKYLSIRVAGGNLGARRIVIDNCAIGENYKVLETTSPRWVRMETFGEKAPFPVFTELVTRFNNPRIPDRPGVLKPAQEKLIQSPESWFGITDAVLHNTPETPKEELLHVMRVFEGGPPHSWAELATRYQTVVAAIIQRWADGKSTDDEARWLDWLVRNQLLANRTDTTPALAKLVAEYRTVDAAIPAPRVVDGLADIGPGRDFSVLIGGNAANPGPPAPRRYLQKLFGEASIRTTGSGRLELADMIASDRNPLTARVIVNRVWNYVFGRGLVASVDNFGLIGDRPTHPELLDYLATRFVQDGWSIKKLIRLLVTSETFRQSGEITSRARELDPENRMLHHYPLRRLEAESIRDSILMASGKLDTSLYGPSTDPHRDQPKDYRRLFSGPLDGNGRRSLYLKVTRMEGTRLLDIFDYPNPMATRGSRDVTNVPAQALTLLNDPFVVSEAEVCARRVLTLSQQSVDARVNQVFRTILSRNATFAEQERFRGLALEVASLHQIRKEDIPDSVIVWKDVAHAIFNLKEFIYVQ